jgi:hypothetical protein
LVNFMLFEDPVLLVWGWLFRKSLVYGRGRVDNMNNEIFWGGLTDKFRRRVIWAIWELSINKCFNFYVEI